MNIGPTIQGLRKKKGYNQTVFGKLIGISQTALSNIELGITSPRKTTLKAICKHLEVPEPLLVVLSVEKSDVAPDKQKLYELLYPTIKDFMKRIFDKGLSGEDF